MSNTNELNIIPQNWSAIEKIEDAVRKQTGDPLAGFNANLFFLGKQRQIAIPVYYRKKTKNGFTKKYFEVLIKAKYCPITGRALYKDSDNQNDKQP